jgi:hypothetical protein
VELGETDQYPLLEIGKIMEIVVHTFHRFDGIVNTVNTLDHASRESMSEVIQYVFFPIIKHIQKVFQMVIFHFVGLLNLLIPFGIHIQQLVV